MFYVLSLRVVSFICLRCFYIASGRWSMVCSRAASRAKVFSLPGAERLLCRIPSTPRHMLSFQSLIPAPSSACPLEHHKSSNDCNSVPCPRLRTPSQTGIPPYRFPSQFSSLPLELGRTQLKYSEPSSPVQTCSTSPTCHPPTSPTSTESPADPSA